MYTPNYTMNNIVGNDGMIKMRKKNYIKERQSNMLLDEEIIGFKTGGVFFSPTSERLWRGKTQSLINKSKPEENFYIKEVMKKFQTNQDELIGYNYKYVLQLSDLLGQKDKDFSKKRLELYNNRIQREKKHYSKTNEKFIKYQTAYKPKKQTNFFMEFFDTRKKSNYLINNPKPNLNNMFSESLYSNKENKESEIYYKTAHNFGSSKNIEKMKLLLGDKSDKKYKNAIIDLSNRKNDNDEQSFDTTSLVGKEDFLVSGDKERYHEYLSREYNFFNQAKIRQMKYIFDKQKRIKLFKKLPNAKYLNYKKENPLRLELFNKINREKEKLAKVFPNSVDKKLYLNNKRNNRKKPKNIFNKDYQNILMKLKRKFDIE